MKERYTTLGIIANTIIDTLDAAGLDGTEMLRDAGLDVAALDWTTEVDAETRRLKVAAAPGLDLRDEVIDAAFAWIVLQCRQLCGDDFSPRRVEMIRPTPDTTLTNA